MAIVTSLLICSPTLQCEYVDKDGQPLSAGIITCFQDNSRTTLKNWYYQSGTPGTYTYISLPNPLTLSAAGTITDVNGVDTLPFFYPYSELDNETPQPYYITVVDSNFELQFTRQNFPFLSIESSPFGPIVPSLDNYIINNRFWRNIGTLTATNVTSMIVAPSQHDGFSMPDIQFIKNTTGAVETITFTPFPLGVNPLQGDITPEFYINHNCTALQAGETLKVYQFPISLHVETLESVEASVTIQAQSGSGSANNIITLYIYQFLGTGVTSPSPVAIQTLVLNNAWQKFTIPFTFPSAAGTVLGDGGDDALYLQVGIPLSVTCDINFTLPSIYLSPIVPTNSFVTYDQIDAIINSPRTGDLRTSLNTFYPYGWVPLNNGTIGNASSNATCRANQDTWQLFNLIWQAFKAYTVSTTNLLAQMVTSAGSNVAYGATAIADFEANNAITLTHLMGKVILGTVPVPALLPAYTTMFTASNAGGFLLLTTSNTVNYFIGMPFYVTNTGGALPTGLVINTIYYVSGFDGATTFGVATSFINAITRSLITYTDAGSGTNSVTAALAGTYEGEYAHTQLLVELAAHTHTVPIALAGSATSPGTVSPVNTSPTTTSSAGSSIPFNVTQPGKFYNMYMKL